MEEPIDEMPELDTTNFSAKPAVAACVGLFLICIALFLGTLTYRVVALWITKDDYVKGELRVTAIDHGPDSSFFGVIVATGEEFHSTQIPTELYEYDSPSDPSGTLTTNAKAEGKIIPIWLALRDHSFFHPGKIQYMSEFDTLPDGQLVANFLTVNLTILLLGYWLTRWSFRQSLARTNELEELG